MQMQHYSVVLFGDLFIFGDMMELMFAPVIVYIVGGILYYLVN
jgi:hypothetical protein